jgi:hypothetical protein
MSIPGGAFNVQALLQRFPTNKRSHVTAHTASTTLTVRQTGSVHSNLGAAGEVIFTLPQNAIKGVSYTFVVQTAQSLTINPGAAGGIYIAGAKLADDADITSAEIGEAVELTCDGNNDWIVTAIVGQWGQAETIGSITVPTGKTVTIADGDALLVGGVIVPTVIPVTFHGQAATAMVDQTFFVANAAYQVVGASFVAAVAEASAASLKIQITKDTSTNAPGAGTDLLTNNTNTGFDGKATANTVQTGTLTATAASLQLAAGDRLSVDFEDAATELVGVSITVYLKRI